MGGDEQRLRAILCRDAQVVQIPDGMWDNISQQLGPTPHVVAAARSGTSTRRDWWRGGFALAVTAGVFWLSVIPAGHQADRTASTLRGTQGRPVVTARAADSDLLTEPRSNAVVRRGSQSPKNRFGAQDAKPRFSLPLQ